LTIAMRNAAIVSSCGMVSDIAQPTTLRENMSRTTARYSQPSRVGTQVMSASQILFGAAAVNCRASRFGASGKEWLLSVVFRNRRF
jgi:hypothetical protein